MPPANWTVKKDPACIGCYHYRNVGSVAMCNYWEDEDELRPSKPGKDCTCFIRAKEYKKMKSSTKYNSKEVFEMLASGMKPPAVASKLDVDSKLISKYYQNHRLQIDAARAERNAETEQPAEPTEPAESKKPEAPAPVEEPENEVERNDTLLIALLVRMIRTSTDDNLKESARILFELLGVL